MMEEETLGEFGKTVLNNLVKIKRSAQLDNKKLFDESVQRSIIDQLLDALQFAIKDNQAAYSIQMALKQLGYFSANTSSIGLNQQRQTMAKNLLSEIEQIPMKNKPLPTPPAPIGSIEGFLDKQSQFVTDLRTMVFMLKPYETATDYFLNQTDREGIKSYIEKCQATISEYRASFQGKDLKAMSAKDFLEVYNSPTFQNYLRHQQQLALLQPMIIALDLPAEINSPSEAPIRNLQKTSYFLGSRSMKKTETLTDDIEETMKLNRDQIAALYLQQRTIKHFNQWELNPKKQNELDKKSAILRSLLYLNANSPTEAKQQSGEPKDELKYINMYLQTTLIEGFPELFSMSAEGFLTPKVYKAEINRALGLDKNSQRLNPEDFDVQTLQRLANLTKPSPLATPLWRVLLSMKPVSDDFYLSKKLKSYQEVLELIDNDQIGTIDKKNIRLNIADTAMQLIEKNTYQLSADPLRVPGEEEEIRQIFLKMKPKIQAIENETKIKSFQTIENETSLSKRCDALIKSKFEQATKIRPASARTNRDNNPREIPTPPPPPIEIITDKNNTPPPPPPPPTVTPTTTVKSPPPPPPPRAVTPPPPPNRKTPRWMVDAAVERFSDRENNYNEYEERINFFKMKIEKFDIPTNWDDMIEDWDDMIGDIEEIIELGASQDNALFDTLFDVIDSMEAKKVAYLYYNPEFHTHIIDTIKDLETINNERKKELLTDYVNRLIKGIIKLGASQDNALFDTLFDVINSMGDVEDLEYLYDDPKFHTHIIDTIKDLETINNERKKELLTDYANLLIKSQPEVADPILETMTCIANTNTEILSEEEKYELLKKMSFLVMESISDELDVDKIESDLFSRVPQKYQSQLSKDIREYYRQNLVNTVEPEQTQSRSDLLAQIRQAGGASKRSEQTQSQSPNGDNKPKQADNPFGLKESEALKRADKMNAHKEERIITIAYEGKLKQLPGYELDEENNTLKYYKENKNEIPLEIKIEEDLLEKMQYELAFSPSGEISVKDEKIINGIDEALKKAQDPTSPRPH